MKKTFIMLLTMVFTLTYTESQAQAFNEGSTALNAGIGIGTALGGYGKANPAFSISLDRGMWEIGGPGIISLGGYAGTTGYKYSGEGYSAKWNYLVIGVRGAYHYNGFDAPELDLYGGLMLAYNAVSYKSDLGEDYFGKSYGSGIGFSGFLGARWFFSEKFGAFAELGYGVSVLNVGVSLKF